MQNTAEVLNAEADEFGLINVKRYAQPKEVARITGLSLGEVRNACQRYKERVLNGRRSIHQPINAEQAKRESRHPLPQEFACRWVRTGSEFLYFIDREQMHLNRIVPQTKGVSRSHKQRYWPLQHAMERMELLEVELARRAGVTPETISRMLSGAIRNPQKATQDNILAALVARAGELKAKYEAEGRPEFAPLAPTMAELWPSQWKGKGSKRKAT